VYDATVHFDWLHIVWIQLDCAAGDAMDSDDGASDDTQPAGETSVDCISRLPSSVLFLAGFLTLSWPLVVIVPHQILGAK